MVKIPCQICHIKGTLQKVGNNYYRIRHYQGSFNKKLRFHYHQNTKTYALQELEKLRQQNMLVNTIFDQNTKNNKVVQFLRSEEGKELKNSYIMHLCVEDLNNKKILNKPTELNPDEELAYLEETKIEEDSVYNRASEFYPKYVDLEHIFAGIFIKELLWS